MRIIAYLQENGGIFSRKTCEVYMRQTIENLAKYRIREREEDGHFRHATSWTSEPALLSILGSATDRLLKSGNQK
jgi:hypothetical protein